jgi:hypothetical protein
VLRGGCVSGNRSRWREQASPQESEAGPAIHLAFEQLEAIDVSFDRSPTPEIAQGRVHRRVVVAEAVGKADELHQTRLLALFQPAVQASGNAVGQDRVKRQEQVLGLGNLGTQLFQRRQVVTLALGELSLGLGEEPARLAC